MPRVAFAASLPLRRTPAFPTLPFAAAVPRRPRRPATPYRCTPPIVEAKKRGGGSKRERKAARSPSAKSSPKPSSSATPAPSFDTDPAAGSPQRTPADGLPADTPSFPGPLAPEMLQTDGMISPPPPPPPAADAPASPGAAPPVEVGDGLDDVDALPVADESLLKLPDLGARDGRVRRKRKNTRDAGADTASSSSSSSSSSGAADVDDAAMEAAKAMSGERVDELTRAYRMGDELGGEGRQAIIDEIEKEPDFLLKVGEADAATGYDLTSALFGRGRPNKQGIYVLPYLQSGHMLLLGITSLIAFIYYPGFPLTEAPYEVRIAIRNAILLVLSANAVLAVFAGRLAVERKQPPWLWVLKTMALGDLAFGELRRNTRPEFVDRRGKRARLQKLQQRDERKIRKSEKRRRPSDKT